MKTDYEAVVRELEAILKNKKSQIEQDFGKSNFLVRHFAKEVQKVGVMTLNFVGDLIHDLIKKHTEKSHED